MKANCIIRHQPFSYLPFGKYNLSESLCVANIAFLEVRQSVALPKTYYHTQDCSQSWSTIIGAVASLSDEIPILG